MSMRKALFPLMALAAIGGDISGWQRTLKERNIKAPHPFSFSAGYYNNRMNKLDGTFNKISKRRKRNKIANQSRRINRK